MTEIIAKTVVKNKFWIVESDGRKIATIQAIDEDGGGGVAYVHNDRREVFPSIKMLCKKYNIEFAKADRPAREKTDNYEVYGFPTATRPHNEILDVQRYLPIFTKSAKSKSYFCAGYYIVRFNETWVRATCPKLITLNRYEYQGPFKTPERMLESLKEANATR